jgi:hypothetical protein
VREYHYESDEAYPWEAVRLTKEAIRARATLVLYAALLSVPFVALVACGGICCGLKPHEVLGISCYQAMLSSVFFFDTLRNAAHECFEEARARGLVVTNRKGIPVIDQSCPHRRLARLAFAIGGRGHETRD